MKKRCLLMSSVILPLALLSCDRQGNADSERKESPPPGVLVAPAVIGTASPSAEYIAQAMPMDEVELVARVEGVLLKRNFDEGSMVKEGDVLFEIERDQYEVSAEQAHGVLLTEEASLKKATLEFERMGKLIKASAVAQKDYDSAFCDKLSAEGRLEEAKAKLKDAQLKLGYTTIKAPFGGRIGFSSFSVGNLVGPGSGRLATVVKTDPVRVQFNVDEKSILEWRLSTLNLSDEQRLKMRASTVARVRLNDGSLYTRDGELSYASNKINSSTGTLLVQALFPNPDGVLTPGMYLRVQLSPKEPPKSTMIPLRSVLESQSGKCAMVVAKDGTVSMRQVKTGVASGLLVQVISGIEPGELVIVDGVQKVRQGAKASYVIDGADGDFSVQPGVR